MKMNFKRSIYQSSLVFAAALCLGGCAEWNIGVWPAENLQRSAVPRNIAAAKAMTCLHGTDTDNDVAQYGDNVNALMVSDYDCREADNVAAASPVSSTTTVPPFAIAPPLPPQ